MSDLPSYISAEHLHDLIRRALDEDVGSGDITTEAIVDAGGPGEAQFVAKADGILAGQAVGERIFTAVDDEICCEWKRTDGETVYRGTVFGTVRGPAASLLTAERLVLNVMQRMSGIASATRRLVDAVDGHSVRILDTRKTAPGLRRLDKWAVSLGGGANHRLGLYDMILIKDNHIAAAGGITPALRAADAYRRKRELDVEIEIETRTLEDVVEVLDSGLADMILLDNMVGLHDGRADVSRLREAVEVVGDRLPTEASGNVTLETIRAIAGTGVAYISSGALTHSVAALDISLEMRFQAALP